jgi:hypothetical protein
MIRKQSVTYIKSSMHSVINAAVCSIYTSKYLHPELTFITHTNIPSTHVKVMFSRLVF